MSEDVLSGLADIQHRMQQALLNPDGPPPSVARWVTASPRMGAVARFAVYWRGYRLRLLEAMRGLHPALCHLLGQPLFDRFAMDYLDTHPPGSQLLFHLGDGFAAHLARTRPATNRRETWPDLMIDLARFECMFTEAIEGPRPDTTTLRAADLPGFDDPHITLVPVPGLRMTTARFPVHEYTGAVHRGDAPEPPPPRPTFLVVTRRDYRVVVRELIPAAYRALRSLTQGRTVAEALGEADPATCAAWLSEWAESRYFAALSTCDSTPEPVLAGRRVP